MARHVSEEGRLQWDFSLQNFLSDNERESERKRETETETERGDTHTHTHGGRKEKERKGKNCLAEGSQPQNSRR